MWTHFETVRVARERGEDPPEQTELDLRRDA